MSAAALFLDYPANATAEFANALLVKPATAERLLLVLAYLDEQWAAIVRSALTPTAAPSGAPPPPRILASLVERLDALFWAPGTAPAVQCALLSSATGVALELLQVLADGRTAAIANDNNDSSGNGQLSGTGRRSTSAGDRWTWLRGVPAAVVAAHALRIVVWSAGTQNDATSKQQQQQQQERWPSVPTNAAATAGYDAATLETALRETAEACIREIALRFPGLCIPEWPASSGSSGSSSASSGSVVRGTSAALLDGTFFAPLHGEVARATATATRAGSFRTVSGSGTPMMSPSPPLHVGGLSQPSGAAPLSLGPAMGAAMGARPRLIGSTSPSPSFVSVAVAKASPVHAAFLLAHELLVAGKHKRRCDAGDARQPMTPVRWPTLVAPNTGGAVVDPSGTTAAAAAVSALRTQDLIGRSPLFRGGGATGTLLGSARALWDAAVAGLPQLPPQALLHALWALACARLAVSSVAAGSPDEEIEGARSSTGAERVATEREAGGTHPPFASRDDAFASLCTAGLAQESLVGVDALTVPLISSDPLRLHAHALVCDARLFGTARGCVTPAGGAAASAAAFGAGFGAGVPVLSRHPTLPHRLRVSALTLWWDAVVADAATTTTTTCSGSGGGSSGSGAAPVSPARRVLASPLAAAAANPSLWDTPALLRLRLLAMMAQHNAAASAVAARAPARALLPTRWLGRDSRDYVARVCNLVRYFRDQCWALPAVRATVAACLAELLARHPSLCDADTAGTFECAAGAGRTAGAARGGDRANGSTSATAVAGDAAQAYGSIPALLATCPPMMVDSVLDAVDALHGDPAPATLQRATTLPRLTRSRQSAGSMAGFVATGTNRTTASSPNTPAASSPTCDPLAAAHRALLGGTVACVLAVASAERLERFLPLLVRSFADRGGAVAERRQRLARLAERFSELRPSWSNGHQVLLCIRGFVLGLLPATASEGSIGKDPTAVAGVDATAESGVATTDSTDAADVALSLRTACDALRALRRSGGHPGVGMHARLILDALSHVSLVAAVRLLDVSATDTDDVTRHCERRDGAAITIPPTVPVDVRLAPPQWRGVASVEERQGSPQGEAGACSPSTSSSWWSGTMLRDDDGHDAEGVEAELRGGRRSDEVVPALLGPTTVSLVFLVRRRNNVAAGASRERAQVGLGAPLDASLGEQTHSDLDSNSSCSGRPDQQDHPLLSPQSSGAALTTPPFAQDGHLIGGVVRVMLVPPSNVLSRPVSHGSSPLPQTTLVARPLQQQPTTLVASLPLTVLLAAEPSTSDKHHRGNDRTLSFHVTFAPTTCAPVVLQAVHVPVAISVPVAANVATPTTRPTLITVGLTGLITAVRVFNRLQFKTAVRQLRVACSETFSSCVVRWPAVVSTPSAESGPQQLRQLLRRLRVQLAPSHKALLVEGGELFVHAALVPCSAFLLRVSWTGSSPAEATSTSELDSLLLLATETGAATTRPSNAISTDMPLVGELFVSSWQMLQPVTAWILAGDEDDDAQGEGGGDASAEH